MPLLPSYDGGDGGDYSGGEEEVEDLEDEGQVTKAKFKKNIVKWVPYKMACVQTQEIYLFLSRFFFCGGGEGAYSHGV